MIAVGVAEHPPVPEPSEPVPPPAPEPAPPVPDPVPTPEPEEPVPQLEAVSVANDLDHEREAVEPATGQDLSTSA